MNVPTKGLSELAGVPFSFEESEIFVNHPLCPELDSHPQHWAELQGTDGYFTELPEQHVLSSASRRIPTYNSEREREPYSIHRRPVPGPVAQTGRVSTLPLATDIAGEPNHSSRSAQHWESQSSAALSSISLEGNPHNEAFSPMSTPSTDATTPSSLLSSGARSPFESAYLHPQACECLHCHSFQQLQQPQAGSQFLASFPRHHHSGPISNFANALTGFGRLSGGEVAGPPGSPSTSVSPIDQTIGHGTNLGIVGYESPPVYTSICDQGESGAFRRYEKSSGKSVDDGVSRVHAAPAYSGQATTGVGDADARPSPKNPRRLTPLFSHITIQCPLCPQKFTGLWRNGNWKRHERSKHNDSGGVQPELMCSGCGKKYKRGDAKKKHEWNKHQIGSKPVKRRIQDSEDDGRESSFCGL